MDHTDKSQGDQAEIFRFLDNELVRCLKRGKHYPRFSIRYVLTHLSADERVNRAATHCVLGLKAGSLTTSVLYSNSKSIHN